MLRLRVSVSRGLGEMDSEVRSPVWVVLPAGPPARLTHPFSARWCPGRQCLSEQHLCVSVSRGLGLSCPSREGACLAPVLPVLLALEEASGASGSRAPGAAAWHAPQVPLTACCPPGPGPGHSGPKPSRWVAVGGRLLGIWNQPVGAGVHVCEFWGTPVRLTSLSLESTEVGAPRGQPRNTVPLGDVGARKEWFL